MRRFFGGREFLVALLLVLPGRAVSQELGDAVSVTDQFEYSYSSQTEREIVENWLDASVLFGSVRFGLLLNHQAPAEEGTRRNELRHRFVEFQRDRTEARAGHFYALFGRGLVLSSYEDRVIRVDTALDGVKFSHEADRWRATVLSGTPFEVDRDVRAADAEFELMSGLRAGASVLTHRSDDRVDDDGSVHREWVAAARVESILDFGDLYAEYGWKKGWDARPVPDDDYENGHALYVGANLFRGPFALSVEAKDYERFVVLRNSDGRTPLNNPPALTREHLYALLSRAAHALDADDERGLQAEATWFGPAGWSVLSNAARTENEAGQLLYEELYGHLEYDELGRWRARGGFSYQDSEGLRQTVVGELTFRQDERRSWTLILQHQHVRLGGADDIDLGAYDQELVELELAVAPHWAFTGFLELNNKFDEQQAAGEKDGPFPGVAVAWTGDRGDAVTLWAGKRQAGQLCAGGVCKFEPAFEGVELFGTLRW